MGTNAWPNTMSLTTAVAKLKSSGFPRLKTWDIDETWLSAVEQVYAGATVEVTVAIPNGDLPKAADAGSSYLQSKVLGSVQKHRGIIKYVAIGNEPGRDLMPTVMLALNNVVQLLANNGLSDVKVIIPFDNTILTNTYPVENSVFSDWIQADMRQILAIAASTSSAISVNFYPYALYRDQPPPKALITLGYCLGQESHNGYGGMLEAQIAGLKYAMDKLTSTPVPVIVGETGWASAGGDGASVANEKTYTEYLRRVAKDPKYSYVQTIFVFEAFDEPWKISMGPDEPYYGLFTVDGTAKFSLAGLQTAAGGGGRKMLSGLPLA